MQEISCTRNPDKQRVKARKLSITCKIQVLNLYKRYQDEVALHEDKKKIEDAQQIVKINIDTYYEVVVPFLEGVPEEIEAMQNIKAAILANSIADKQYF